MSAQKVKIPLRHYDPAVEEMIKTLKLAQSSGVSQEIIDSLERTLQLALLKDDFVENLSSKDSEGCANLLAEAYNHDWDSAYKQGKTIWNFRAGMISGTLEGQFLKSMVSVQRAKKALEIGMFTGFGALSMAEGLPDDGQVVTIDNCDYLETVVQPFLDQSPHGKKVKIIIGDAREVMRKMASAGEKFDFVFLDAAKDIYEDCFKIIFNENLLAPNGTVMIDNAFFHGRAYDPDAKENPIKSFANFLATQHHLHKVVIPMRDGVYMVRRLTDVTGQTAK